MIRRFKAKVRSYLKGVMREAIEEALLDDAYNMERQILRDSMVESARYIVDNIDLSKKFADRYHLMEHCLGMISENGLILEFGVYKGNSIRFLAKHLPDREISGFDSFEGLAEPWIFSATGTFADVDRLPEVPSNVTLIKGWFQDTLPPFLATHPGNISLLHIDSDLYSSCAYVLNELKPRLVPGSLIVFDELLNYPRWREGEFKAFEEWRAATGALTEFLGYTACRGVDWSGHQVATRIKALGAVGA